MSKSSCACVGGAGDGGCGVSRQVCPPAGRQAEERGSADGSALRRCRAQGELRRDQKTIASGGQGIPREVYKRGSVDSS